MAGVLTGVLDDGTPINIIVGSDGNIHPFQTGGGRNLNSATNNFDAVKHEANSVTLANSAAAQNIGTGGTTPVYLMGITVVASTTGTITIAGFTNPSGTATSLVIPAITLTTGQPVHVLIPASARRMESGCTMTCATAADGPNILVDFRPIG